MVTYSLDAQIPLRGRRVTVMGLGRFGGGTGAVRFLTRRGARVTISDCASEEQLAESLSEIGDCGVQAVHVGGHRVEDVLGADLVVVNPAIPRSHPLLQMACQAGVPMTSEMRLFFQYHRGKTIGVTGSNGKSTTTALIHSILSAGGLPARLGGNIGKSLLPELEEIGPDDWSVLELSSFQLDDLNRLPVSPDVAVVTNFAPNHLDWHGSLAEYRRAKQAIFRWQTSEGIAVVNVGDVDLCSWPTYGKRLVFGESPGSRVSAAEWGVVGIGGKTRVRGPQEDRTLEIEHWLRLPGRHNLENARAAACVGLALGLDDDAIRAGIERFEPLPHRLQFVAEVAGRRFYNDSLATTPESAIVGMQSFREPLVLLLGGYDKQVDLQEMALEGARRARAIALMGQTAPLLAEKIRESSGNASPRMRLCSDFADAFDWACAASQPGDVILLSPGCASYDWFRNFADRGNQFSQRVRDLAGSEWPQE